MRGFTLIEILGAMALAALVIAGGLFVAGRAREGALRAQTRMQLATLAAEVEAYRTRTGSYPQTLGALKTITRDAWGNEIAYQAEAAGFVLASAGAEAEKTSDDLKYESTKE